MSEEYDDESRYRRARLRLPGLLGESQRQIWMMGAALILGQLFIGFMWLRTNSQLASIKVEKSSGWVVVLDAKGEPVNLPVASADDFRLADGMVIDKLAATVTCMHGLDDDPRLVVECWKRSRLLFVGEAATQFETFNLQLWPHKIADIQRQQQAESIVVEVRSWAKPEPKAPNRYWLRWNRVHKPYGSGKEAVETWSGTFDVELVPLQRDNTSGMRIVRWEWHQDLTGATKGAG